MRPIKARIMAVDDDEIIRELLVRMLGKCGYAVTVCSSGYEAIEVYSASPESFDLVLMDIIMPGLNGAETFFKLKEIRNDIKCVVLSGYTENLEAQQIIDNGGLGFILKPVSQEKLIQVIDRALNTKGIF